MPVGIDALSEETACIGHKEGGFPGISGNLEIFFKYWVCMQQKPHTDTDEAIMPA